MRVPERAARPVDGPPAFRIIDVAGTHFEMGVMHGRAAGDLLLETLKLYQDRFRVECGLSWDEAMKLSRGIRSAVGDYDPGLLREMEGIAEGSGHPIEAIVAINSRTEIMALAKRDLGAADECTAAACLPEVTATGHTLLGRNWDQDLRILKNAMVMRIRPDDGPSMIVVTEAGILIRDGVNEAGLGVTGNMLRCDQDGQDVLGMPVAVIRRRILNHSTIAPAVREVFDAPRAHSINHLIADAGGEAIDLEAAPRDVFWVLPEDGILTHSNHFRDPRAAVTVSDRGPAQSPSTLYRDRRVRKRLGERSGEIGVADMQAAFRDHYGWPDSVCNHPKSDVRKPPGGSVASVVMDLDERRLWVAPYPVCENEYTEYSLA